MDIKVFEQNIEATRTALGEALLSMSIWSSETGLVLAEWRGNETAVALLTQLLDNLDELLRETVGNPTKAGDYLYIELKDNKTLVLIDHGKNVMQGWLLDSSKTKAGIVLGMALPSTIKNLSNI